MIGVSVIWLVVMTQENVGCHQEDIDVLTRSQLMRSPQLGVVSSLVEMFINQILLTFYLMDWTGPPDWRRVDVRSVEDQFVFLFANKISPPPRSQPPPASSAASHWLRDGEPWQRPG